jgi:2-polyprenyl-3-methyl-5-hydroxy-6-metoxy-1,4-benzoquinol methylase
MNIPYTSVKSPITGGETKQAGVIPTMLIKKNIKGQYRAVSSEIEELFTGLSSISILECKDTGYKFYYPFFDTDGTFYNKIGREERYYLPHRWEFDIALKFINPVDKICEIGAGYGYFFDYLTNINGKGQYYGIELNSNAVEVSKQKGYEMSNLPIQDFCKIHEKEFDTVCFFQVLEHIRDVDLFMKSAIKILKDKGKLLIAVPNNDAFVTKYAYLKSVGNVPPHHTGLWDKRSLINLGKYYRLKLLLIKEQPLPKHLAGNYYRLKMAKNLGGIGSIIVLATRWLVKIFIKKRAHKLLGPTVFIAFEKID